MSEIDTLTFMEKNGREFFCSDPVSDKDLSGRVEISLELSIPKIVLQKMAVYCRGKRLTIPEFISEVLEGWFE